MKDHREITLTGREIYEVVPALIALTGRQLPIGIAHRLAMTLREIRREHTTLEELSKTLMDKHIEKDDKGNWKPGEPSLEGNATWSLVDAKAFEKENEELLSPSLTMKIFPVALKDFGEDFVIAPLHLERLLYATIISLDEEKEA
jgi:hypothetical protein